MKKFCPWMPPPNPPIRKSCDASGVGGGGAKLTLAPGAEFPRYASAFSSSTENPNFNPINTLPQKFLIGKSTYIYRVQPITKSLSFLRTITKSKFCIDFVTKSMFKIDFVTKSTEDVDFVHEIKNWDWFRDEINTQHWFRNEINAKLLFCYKRNF